MIRTSNTFGDNVKIIVSSSNIIGAIAHYAYNDDGLFNYSTDFLYLRKHVGDGESAILNLYKATKNKNISHTIDDEVVSFISSFTNGSVHGFVAIWNYIIPYLENKMTHKVLLSKRTLKGIRDLVAHCIGEDKIITLNTNDVYQFRRIHFIPITEYHFSDGYWKKYNPIFVKLIINPTFDNEGKHNLCMLKAQGATTQNGINPLENLNKFCNINNLYLLLPYIHNEIETANLVWNCESVIFSWGTAYYKNIRYIGDKCKKIYVLVPTGCYNDSEYNPRKNRPDSHTYKKYRNADVKYFVYGGDISKLTIEDIEKRGTIHPQNEYIDIRIIEVE